MSSEKFESKEIKNEQSEQPELTPLTEAELTEAEAMYAVGGQTNSNGAKAVLGAMVLGAAFAAAPNEASAQSKERVLDSANMSVESNKRSVREGVSIHPELGELHIQIFYKPVDSNKPVFGDNYEVQINGVVQKVVSSRFLRNGQGSVQISNPDGTKASLNYPSLQNASVGAEATFTAKEGEPPVPIR